MRNAGTAGGLNSAEEIIQAADAITEVADVAQRWVIKQFSANRIDQAEAHELFASINQVRHVANISYVTAAAVVVKGLGESQQYVLNIINDAKDIIGRIEKVKLMIDLMADMVALAAAINAGKPGPILASLLEVRQDTEDIKAITDYPPTPPAGAL
jgi:hypothetical protein